MKFKREVPRLGEYAINPYSSLIDKYTELLDKNSNGQPHSVRTEQYQRQLDAICRDSDFIYEVIFVILYTSALVNKDYAFIAKLYKVLNLYDNKRLSKTRKDNFLIGSFNLLGTSYFFSAADIIYASVIICAAEECAKNSKNVQLWDTIAEYVFDTIYKDVSADIVKSGYCVSFLAIYLTEVPPEFTDDNVDALVSLYNNGKRLFLEGKKQNLHSLVNDCYDIKDAMNRKRYERLLNTTLGEVCSCANCKTFSDLVTRIRNSLGFNFNPNWDEKDRDAVTISDIVSNVMNNHQLTIGLLRADAPVINEEYVKKHLTMVIDSELVDRGFYDKCYDISRVEITNYKTILSNLVFSIFVDIVFSSMDSLMENYYQSFSFEKVDNVATIQEMARLINTLSNQKMKVEGQLIRLQGKYDYAEKLLKAKEKEEGRIIDEHIQSLEKRNEELTADNAKLQAQIKSLEEYLTLQTKEEEPLNNEINTSLLYSNRYLFVGGRIETIAELKTIFTSSVFTSNETDSINAGNIDYIVMFPKYMSHALYYKCINIARDNGIKVIYVLDNNMDIILKKITEEIS